jgi:hypothetical protein
MYGYIEDLKFAVEVFDERGELKEVLGRLHDLDAAREAYQACRTKYPKKILYLCHGGRILRRSDQDADATSVMCAFFRNNPQASAFEFIGADKIAWRNSDVLVHLPVGSGTPFPGSATTPDGVALDLHGFRSTLSSSSR